jgi:undecaprenyl diphosphate synthase
MELFMRALDRETKELHENGVRVRFIGDLSAFSPEMRNKIDLAMRKTENNQRTILNVAANYGGRWDILNAARKAAQAFASGEISLDQINESYFSDQTSLTAGHDPDLFIRTGGEVRISNFLLWQSAYTELYFTETLWPDFGPEALDRAIAVFRSRERRFGLTGEQLRRSSAQGS